MTAPSFRSGGTASGSTLTLAKPVGLANGDLMVVAVTSASLTPSAPSGWTLQEDVQTASSTVQHLRVWTKTVTDAAGEPSSYAFTGASTTASGVIVAYPNAAVDVDGSQVSSVISASIVAPSVTTTGPGRRVIVVFTVQQVATISVPAGVTLRESVSGSGFPISLADYVAASAGATGSKTAMASQGQVNIGYTLALVGLNQAPNAPTLINPATGGAVDLGVVNRFTWTFSDPDAGDSQSKFDLRYSSDGGATWTTVTQTTPNSYYDFPADTFAAGNYEWQVRTYDALGEVGPYSASAFFTAEAAPDTPTITEPVDGDTINASTVTVTFSYPTLTEYQWRVVGDAGGIGDTGNVINAGATVTDVSSRSFTVTGLPNSTTVHIQVRVQDDGLWSDWADSTNPVSYDPPPAPDVTVTPDDATASITVTWTTAAPGTDEVAAVSIDIYVSTDGGTTSTRRATGLATNGTWIDRTPASGVTYSYEVVAVAASGVETGSGWVT